MNNVFVGEDIILPRSPRSQNALPYVTKTKILISPVGVGALDDPRNIGVRTVLSSACHPERSRTFGFVSGNIANKSKSENCQDNFRDLLRFILSFWH